MIQSKDNHQFAQPEEPNIQPSRNQSGLRLALRRAGWIVAAGVLLTIFAPRAFAFGMDDVVNYVMGCFNQLNGAILGTLPPPLTAIQGIVQQELDYDQNVIWPTSSIQQAQQQAGASLGTAQQMDANINTPRSSATLPVTRQLEQQLLSGDPNQVGNVSSSYAQVYGSLPANGAPAQVLNMVDMTDAQAQDAQKRAIELDSLATREMEVAQDMLTQLQTASPGSASIINAQAAAWVLQGNAYSQSAMAEILRTRSAAVSAAGTFSKDDANKTNFGTGALQNLLNFGQGQH